MSEIRKLTQDERNLFSNAVTHAVLVVPSFRDAIALMRPFYDGTAKTAYTDENARVGLSPWFFNLNTYQRGSVVLHETMHTLNNHFIRRQSLNADPQLWNLAGDFEINSGLVAMPKIDLINGVMPDVEPYSYPRNLMAEKYLHLLKKDQDDGEFTDPDCPQHGDGDSDDESDSTDGEPAGEDSESDDDSKPDDASESDSAGADDSDDSKNDDGTKADDSDGSDGTDDSQKSDESGDSDNGSSDSDSESDQCTCQDGTGGGDGSSGCDIPTEERADAADKAGVARASDAEQNIAKKNTTARIIEELKESMARGDRSRHDFLTLAQRLMAPPKVKWQSIFRRSVSKSNDAVVRGRADYSYKKVNRRMHDSEYIFPGMIQYKPTALLGIDSSGSMDNEDFNRALNEVEGILKSLGKGKNTLKLFFIDAKIGSIKPVNSLKNLEITGGGGTDMSVGVKYVNELKPKERPDVFCLITDGGTDWVPYEKAVIEGKRLYNHILLITRNSSYKNVPESLKKFVTVIDISGDR